MNGLDEQTQGLEETISLLKGIVCNASIKIYISSRPWNVFEEAFSDPTSHRLNLQDLTKHDIQLYVEGKLVRNEKFPNVDEHDARYRTLVYTIVKRAQGVFFWVFLVVESLLRGLREADDIADLQTKLDTIPDDLTGYFWRVFETIDSSYHS